MGVALAFIDKIVSILPSMVALFETMLGADHPAVAQMRDAAGSLQAAHQDAVNAIPKS